MRKQKISLVLLAVAIFGIMGVTAVSAYEVADSFQSPMDSYVINNHDTKDGGNNRFGKWLPTKQLYHAGEDLKADPLTPVRAIANGKVAQSQTPSGGYGQVVVLEHTLPDGNKIISIYGHLSKEKGYEMIKLDPTGKEVPVIKGQLIGYTGYKYEIVEGEPHLHFGIKKGKYAGYYEGRTTLAGLNNFYKPSDYLNLVRAVNTNEVYRLSNLGSKAYVSATSMTSCGWRPMDVRLVSSTELNQHSTFSPQAVCFASGTFIKRANSPEISMIVNYPDKPKPNRYRQPFASWEAYLKYGGKSDQSNVKIVSSEEYNLHVQGATLS